MPLKVNDTLVYRLADSVALRSDRVDTLADLELHCPHMAYGPLSHDAAQMYESNRSFIKHCILQLDKAVLGASFPKMEKAMFLGI